ncbi:MAG: hypothetical protein II336_20455 [Loktanella sp.]|nr:hypothetical protein [Loktanella sp.]
MTAAEARFAHPDLGHLPGPRTIPFIGKTLSFGLDPCGTNFDQVDRFGDVFRMKVFGETCPILAKRDALEQVYMNRKALHQSAGK